jgi:signal transduction histidine kinase
LHGRTQYLDTDRTLSEEAALFAPVLSLLDAPTSVLGETLLPGIDTSLAAYGPSGEVLAIESTAGTGPPLDALATIEKDDGPAYDWFLRKLPGPAHDPPGAFATVRSSSGSPRVRLYALPVVEGEELLGYVVTWTSLASIDAALVRFRAIIFGLAAVGVAAIWVTAFLLARLALAPVRQVIAAAQTIARQREFTHRVPEATGDDELGRLGSTFNEMLEALEDAYRAQQRFVADAAHELRAPLTAIRGNIELIAHIERMPPRDRQEALAQLEQESLRLARLVEELLTLARSDAGQRLDLREVELDAVVLRAVADLEPSPTSARVEIGELEQLTVLGDRDRLHQLVTILVDNGRKYAADGGVRIELTAANQMAMLRVADSGIGISTDDLPHIFERFYRADRARSRDPGGSGLGLPIAAWIVEQHGGQISVDSDPGGGTTVVVEVPRTGASGRDDGAEESWRVTSGRGENEAE